MFVTRADLFDLVWSQPRTTLAARFKISDVAIAKHCRSSNIPMPPPGYWARVAAGTTVKRPALPVRLPGEKDLLAIGEPRFGSSASHVGDEPLSFPEDMGTLVAAAVERLGRVTAERDLADPYSGLARVLKKEDARRQKFKETSWSYYEPRFTDAVSQRQLPLYSSVFRAFSRLGIDGALSEDSEWKQGTGTVVRLVGTLNFGGACVRLSFVAASRGKDAGMRPLVDGDSESSCHSTWVDAPQLPLEKQLDAIAKGMLVCAEVRLRAHAERLHAWRVQERERRQLEQEQQLRAQREAHEAQLLREGERRRQALYAITTQRQRALEIRSLVAALKATRLELSADVGFQAWCEFAAGEADRLDPILTDWNELARVTAASAPIHAPEWQATSYQP